MKKINNSYGVSESIGYILILGIMVTGIGLVTLYGYPILLQEQANANIRNMERNMIVLQTDIDSLTFKSVPYKETTMQVSGGTLFITKSDPSDPTQPYFTIQGSTGILKTFYPGDIQFQPDTNNMFIGLQNDAVIAQYFDSGSSMLSKPRWFFDAYLDPFSGATTRTLYIPLIKIDSDQVTSLSGITTVQMEVIGTPTTTEYDGTDTYVITYNMGGGNYPEAWRNFFADGSVFPPPDCVPSGQTLSVTADRLIIKEFTIKI